MLYPARWKKITVDQSKSWKIYCSVFWVATRYINNKQDIDHTVSSVTDTKVPFCVLKVKDVSFDTQVINSFLKGHSSVVLLCAQLGCAGQLITTINIKIPHMITIQNAFTCGIVMLFFGNILVCAAKLCTNIIDKCPHYLWNSQTPVNQRFFSKFWIQKRRNCLVKLSVFACISGVIFVLRIAQYVYTSRLSA